MQQASTTVSAVATSASAISGSTVTASSTAAAPASSAIADVQNKDPVQLSADMLKLTGATAVSSPASTGLSAGGNLISAANQAIQGNTLAAASSASTALTQLAPALDASPVGAVLDATVIAAGSQKAGAQAQALKATAKQVVAKNLSPWQRFKAACNLTNAAQQLANFYRIVGNAGVKLLSFGLTRMTHVQGLEETAARATEATAKIAESPFGRACKFLNKWIPLLNIAGVVMSTVTAVDVFQTPGASRTSKALAVFSVGTAVAGFFAAFMLGGWAFMGIIGASIIVDLALAKSRKEDASSHNTDQEVGYALHHPAYGLATTMNWAARAIPKETHLIVTGMKATLSKLYNRISGNHPNPGQPAPR